MPPTIHSPTCPPPASPSAFFVSENLLAFTPFPAWNLCVISGAANHQTMSPHLLNPPPSHLLLHLHSWHCFPWGCPISLSHGPFHSLFPKVSCQSTIFKMPTWSYCTPGQTSSVIPFCLQGKKYLHETCIHWRIFKILPFVCPNNLPLSPQYLSPAFMFSTLVIFRYLQSLGYYWLLMAILASRSCHMLYPCPGMLSPLALSFLRKAAPAVIQTENPPQCPHCIMDTSACVIVCIPFCFHHSLPARCKDLKNIVPVTQ